MDINKLLAETRGRMNKTIDDMTREMASIRTGRASIHILDNIQVDYYGTPTPINQLATLHAPEASLVTVQPWDPSQIGAIEKALQASDLGINPSNDGKIIRIPIPPLTEERRKELARWVGKIAEDHRTAIRNIRREANDHLKKSLKDKELSEDAEYRALGDVQKLTDEYIKKIDDLASAKETEILEV